MSQINLLKDIRRHRYREDREWHLTEVFPLNRSNHVNWKYSAWNNFLVELDLVCITIRL